MENITPKFCAQTHLSILTILLCFSDKFHFSENPRTTDLGPLQPHTLNS